MEHKLEQNKALVQSLQIQLNTRDEEAEKRQSEFQSQLREIEGRLRQELVMKSHELTRYEIKATELISPKCLTKAKGKQKTTAALDIANNGTGQGAGMRNASVMVQVDCHPLSTMTDINNAPNTATANTTADTTQVDPIRGTAEDVVPRTHRLTPDIEMEEDAGRNNSQQVTGEEHRSVIQINAGVNQAAMDDISMQIDRTEPLPSHSAVSNQAICNCRMLMMPLLVVLKGSKAGSL